MLRPLRLESLESRRLLAGDACQFELPRDAENAEILPAAFSTTSPGADSFAVSTFSASTFRAADAGSSPATAADIGPVDGTVRLSGSLGRFDRADMVAFTVERDANVRLTLTGLNRNANLYLSDGEGNVLARSTRFGRSSEVIRGPLEAGEYFVSVWAQSFRSTTYRLSITAALQPEAPPIPDPPPADPPTSDDPVADDSGGSEAPATGTQPLSEVAYFGGSREWNLNAVGAPESWAAGYTGEGIVVAVVDTGVDLDHPDLVNNLFVNVGEIAGNGIDDDGNGYIDDVRGYDFADRDADANDVGGHGTHVAGTIAAGNNGFGATGVAPDATILPVRVLGANGSGSSFDVAAGIRYAADLGADIINLSLGGGYSRAIDSAIEYAKSLGSFIVAAAGNESASVPGFPARFSTTDDNVVSVGAVNSSGRLAGFSNDVGNSGAVQVDAPGVGIFSTYVGGRYATLSGTSMAAPHVAGLAALTLSANPDLTSSELRDLLASGTVGRATGSDAIGTVAATTTVAYASAGIRGNQAIPASSSVTASTGSLFSGRIRSTAYDPIASVKDSAMDHDESLLMTDQVPLASNPTTSKTVDPSGPSQTQAAGFTDQIDSVLRDEAFVRDHADVIERLIKTIGSRTSPA